ncbi:hypothetical protein ACFXQA_05595 [Microbacterium sp. P07]|uniref:hypothetical protein n=1 Tax=Microbacterium sp. P07 TaxID=3366952 RepID=UPI0037464CC8
MFDSSRLLSALDTSWVTGAQSALASVAASNRALFDSSRLLSALDTSWVTGAQSALASVAASNRALFDSSRLLSALDTSWVTGAQSALASVAASNRALFDSSRLLSALDTSWLAELVESARRGYRLLPPNWWGVKVALDLEGEELRGLLLEEGIPLAWVPSAGLIDRLVSADSPRQRRQYIRDGWRGIVRDCEVAVGSLSSRDGRDGARFVRLCADAIRDGHFETAQALAANVIDTLGNSFVKNELVGHRWQSIVARNGRERLSRLDIRALLVLGPLAAGHDNYRSGEPIPRSFTRHATAHGVSKRQYTKVNSLIAVMNATSLLCWLERDTGAFDVA